MQSSRWYVNKTEGGTHANDIDRVMCRRCFGPAVRSSRERCPGRCGRFGSGVQCRPAAAQAQFAERPTHHGVVKCYREFVIGPYRCDYFRNQLFFL